MKSRILILAGAAALALARLAAAESINEGWYVEPALLGVDPDTTQSQNTAIGYRLAVGKTISDKWDAELALDHTEHDATPGKLKLSLLSLDALRIYHRDERFSPFYELGLGSLYSSYTGGEISSNLGAKAGVGGMLNVNPGPDSRFKIIGDVGLRVEDTIAGNRMVDPYIGLGVRFLLGGHTRAAPALAFAPPPPPPPAPPVDSDHDGVADTADQCPNTPAGAEVDARGCELDADRDGVVDRLDKCPNTPAGAVVDARGCELDSDHDGVVDRLDKCPTTPAGDKVDAEGCSLTIALQVQFDTAKATIKPVSYPELDAFVAFMKNVPSARGELQGHTDNVGKAAYNLKLSQQRADSVKAYVVGKGVDASRISTRGYGLTQPVADNKTAEGRAQNRRVLFVRN
jgi:OOP family OmpA-OmpF porin